MRFRFLPIVLLVTLVASMLCAQSTPRVQLSHTTESLRGVSAVSHQIAWASGAHGTYLRTTDAGRTWTPAQVPDAGTLDFRAVVAFSADEAFLMSAGPGDQSRIYHTADAGQHWQLQFTNTNPKGFFDSMAFWDAKHGVVLGDPIPDESGKLKFEVLRTDDGQTWHAVAPVQLPVALEGEGAFAASNRCIAILSNAWQRDDASAPRAAATAAETLPHDSNLWFATGGRAARVFHSPDAGQTWEVFYAPIVHGPESAGIFSIAFRNSLDGVIAGGDYKNPDRDGPNLAFTHDGGKTWELSSIHPQAYFSAVAYDHEAFVDARRGTRKNIKTEFEGEKSGASDALSQRLFIVGQDFVLDLRPPHDPRRIDEKKIARSKMDRKTTDAKTTDGKTPTGKKNPPLVFNAISAYPEGGALLVGAKGTLVFIP